IRAEAPGPEQARSAMYPTSVKSWVRAYFPSPSSFGLRGLGRRFGRLRWRLARLPFMLAFGARGSFRCRGFRGHRFNRIGRLAASGDDAGRRMFAELGKIGRAGDVDAREITAIVQPRRLTFNLWRMPPV